MKWNKLVTVAVMFLSISAVAADNQASEGKRPPHHGDHGRGGPNHAEMDALLSVCKTQWDNACGVPDRENMESFHTCVESNKANFSQACQDKMASMSKPPQKPAKQELEREETQEQGSGTTSAN